MTNQGFKDNNLFNFGRVEKILFLFTVSFGFFIFWLTPHLPMVDLPQLSGQMTLLRDLLKENSPWQDIFRVNFFTPYLAPYALWLPLTFIFSITISGKILLSAGYLFFIWTAIRLGKTFNADSRLDWLIVPCYFGFAFKFGFVTTLLAAPFGLWFVMFAKLYTDAPTIRKGLALALLGYFLFFCHGFVFIFSIGIGLCFLLFRFKLTKRFVLMSAPYLGLFALCLFFYVFKSTELPKVAGHNHLEWGWYQGRLEQLFIFTLGTEVDHIFWPIVFFFAAFPFLLGMRLKRTPGDYHIPFGILLLAWFSWPSWGNVLGMDFAFIYHRFAIFFFPFYILIFRKPAEISLRLSDTYSTKNILVTAALICSCWIFFAVQISRVTQFGDENKDFEKVVSQAEPGQQLLYLVFDGASVASNNNLVYRHFPAWYQAEHGGVVEFNFASYLNQVVIYKSTNSTVVSEFGSKPQSFRWKDNSADRFQYIMIRRKDVLPSFVFDGAGCQITNIAESGTWSLYRGCAALRL